MSNDDPAPIGDRATPPPERTPRVSVMLSATVEYFGGGGATKHRVRDLSSGGIRIDQAGRLQPGATVLISVGALEAVGATVKWVNEDNAGLAFAQPIDPEQARTKSAIAPAVNAKLARVAKDGGAWAVPTAGWIPDSRSPYRR